MAPVAFVRTNHSRAFSLEQYGMLYYWNLDEVDIYNPLLETKQLYCSCERF